MAFATPQTFLSASATGAPIALGTGTTAIHTVPTTGVAKDEFWLYASNTTAGDIIITLTIDGVEIDATVPANNQVLVVQGHPLAAGVVVTGLGASAGVNAYGYVNRYAQ